MAIAVAVVLRENRAGNHALYSLTAHGHAEGSINTLCAAVSMHLRSIGRALAANKDIRAYIDAPQRGDMEIAVHSCEEHACRWLEGVTAVLMQGLRDVEREYPGHVSLKIDVRHVDDITIK